MRRTTRRARQQTVTGNHSQHVANQSAEYDHLDNFDLRTEPWRAHNVHVRTRLAITGAGRLQLPSSWLAYPLTAAAGTTIPAVAGTVNFPPQYMNVLGKKIEVCGEMTSTASAATIVDVQFQWDALGQNTAGKGGLDWRFKPLRQQLLRRATCSSAKTSKRP